MVQIDVPMAACTALMLADAARRQLHADNDPTGRNFFQVLAKVNLFLAFFFVWIPVYFVVEYFPWETTYLYDYARMSRFVRLAFIPIVILAVFAAGNVAFLVAWRWLRAGRIKRVRIAYAAIWIFATVWVLGFFPRAATIPPAGTQFQDVDASTFDEYKALRGADGRPVLFYVLPFDRARFDVDQVHHTDSQRSDPFAGTLIFCFFWWVIPQVLLIRHLLGEGRRIEQERKARAAPGGG